MTIETAGETQLQRLARSVDCMTEDEFTLLANITPVTAESWRKRGRGPAYVLLGTRYLYPCSAVKEHLMSRVKDRRPNVGKDLL